MCDLSGESSRSSKNCQSWIGPLPAGTGGGRQRKAGALGGYEREREGSYWKE